MVPPRATPATRTTVGVPAALTARARGHPLETKRTVSLWPARLHEALPCQDCEYRRAHALGRPVVRMRAQDGCGIARPREGSEPAPSLLEFDPVDGDDRPAVRAVLRRRMAGSG